MRPIRSALLPLVLLAAAIGPAAAQNVCVHGADGATVCGPVADRNDRQGSNPFDQPGVAQPINPSPSVVDRRPPARRAYHDAERRPPPPRHAYRQPPPPPNEMSRRMPPREADRRPPPREADRRMPPPSREFDRRPPPRQALREDDRRYADRGPPPPRTNRAPPPRYSEADRRQSERDRYRQAMRVERDRLPADYDARLRELEREIRMLRERERYSISQRPRTRGDRYSADD
jgi:hypothetical protein